MSSSDKLQIAKLLKSKKWEPTYLEKIMLESQFPKDQPLSQESRQQLSKKLHNTFNTTVSADELQEWFEEEMSKTSKRLKTDTLSANSYIKLTTEEVNILEENFEMKNYPDIEEMQEMAQNLGVNLAKIENWFKHHRRSLAKKGQFQIKTKRYFQPNDLKVLMNVFLKTPHPTQQQISVVAQQLNCTENQIKNWYSNKRKRVRNIKKNSGNESFSLSDSPNSSPIKNLESPPILPISNPSLSASHFPDPTNLLSFLKDRNSSSLNFSYTDPQQFYQPQDLNSNRFFSQHGFNTNAINHLQFTAPVKNNMGLSLCNFQEMQNLLAFRNNLLVQNSSLSNLNLFNWRNGIIFSRYGNFIVQEKASH